MSEHGDGKKLAVLMDGTNCYFEIRTDSPDLAPNKKRELWVKAVVAVAERHGAKANPPPLTFWRALMEARRLETRGCKGRRLSCLRYWENVNRRALKSISELGMFPLEFATRRCGRELYAMYRELSKPDNYAVYRDMVDFVAWLIDREDGLGAELFMVTTQTRPKIEQMFEVTEGQRDLFSEIIVAQEISVAEKLSREFWERVFTRAGVTPERAMVIGSNCISDGYAAEAGVRAVFILDRDGSQEDYFRGVREQTTSRGIPLVAHDDPAPPGRFFAFVRGPSQDLRDKLLMVKRTVLEKDVDVYVDEKRVANSS